MINEVILPKHGLQMTEGCITKWHKNKGDFVEKGDPLFDMETDKAILTVESAVSGTLVEIIHEAGETVPVATVIGFVGDDNDVVPSIDKPNKKEEDFNRVFITPRARTYAMENSISINDIVPSGPDNLIIERDVKTIYKEESVTTLVIRVDFKGILSIVNNKTDLKAEKVIEQCLISTLKRCNVGERYNASNFNILYLGVNNVTLLYTKTSIPSIYAGKPDELGYSNVTITLNGGVEEMLEFINILNIYMEQPLLSYFE